jgi:hypothetical protein
MYLGNQPALSYTSFAKQDFTTSATTSYTLDNPVANANELALFINNVRQEPTTAYSASGTTLTLTSATASSDDMYCVYLGKAVQTVNPPNASVGTAQLVDDAVTKAKTSNLMYPSFQAYLSSNQTVTSGTTTKIQLNTEDFDTDNAYDNSTNYRFTPQVSGKYFVYATVRGNAGTSSLDLEMTAIYKNGSSYIENQVDYRGNDALLAGISVSAIIDMNGSSDYLECFARCLGGTTINGSSTRPSIFGAYRIGD